MATVLKRRRSRPQGGFCLHKEKGDDCYRLCNEEFRFAGARSTLQTLTRTMVPSQGGKRPVIVIQNNTGNKFAPTVIVAAVTSKVSKKPNQPTHVLIEQNPAFSRPSVVLLEQIFTIDKERINSFMGMTSEWEMAQIEKA